MSTFEIYAAPDGWRWRLVAENGKVTADSGEAYSKRWTAKRAVDRLRVVAAKALVVYA